MISLLDNPAYPFKTKPLQHQSYGLRHHGGREYYALNCEMGTGKTWIVIVEAGFLWAMQEVDGLMVFAPKGVHTNWVRNELPTHMPDWVDFSAYAWTDKNTKTEARKMEKALYETNDSTLRIFTMNTEALSTPRGFKAAQEFCRSCKKLMLVADESQMFKQFDGVRSKNLRALAPMSKYRRIMSGSPILNGPFDAFAQYMFLDESILRITSYYAFKANYAVMLDPKHPKVANMRKAFGLNRAPQIVDQNDDGTPRYRRLDQLAKLIAPHTYRVLKKDCLDLPEKVYTKSYFEMSPKQQQAYDLLREKARVICESETETPLTKLDAMMKLQQVLSGYIISPETRKPFWLVPDEENEKLLLLERRMEAVLEAGKSIIVWARFIPEIHHIIQLCNRRGWPAVTYYGATPGDERMEAIRAFQAREKVVFISQQQAGSTGITLTAAEWVMYYSNTFALANRLQSEDRAHRIGQKQTVTYEDIACPGTIDEKIALALIMKKSVADIINGDRAVGLLGDQEEWEAIMDAPPADDPAYLESILAEEPS